MAPLTKKRKIAPTEEIAFDESAREEYLTGFHKRKQQRIRHAQEIATRRERDEKIRERKQMRENRQKQLQEHIAKVNSMLSNTNATEDSSEEDVGEGSNTFSEEAWEGFEEALEVNRVDEYIDEDKYATVTVESVDVSKDGLRVTTEEADGDDGIQTSTEEEKLSSNSTSNTITQKKRGWTEEKPMVHKSKKKKKFRYESVAERKAAREKQKARTAKAAKGRRGR